MNKSFILVLLVVFSVVNSKKNICKWEDAEKKGGCYKEEDSCGKMAKDAENDNDDAL